MLAQQETKSDRVKWLQDNMHRKLMKELLEAKNERTVKCNKCNN